MKQHMMRQIRERFSTPQGVIQTLFFLMLLAALLVLAPVANQTVRAEEDSPTAEAELFLPAGDLDPIEGIEVEIPREEFPAEQQLPQSVHSPGHFLLASPDRAFWESCSSRYYYNQMNAAEQAAYDTIYDMLMDEYLLGTESVTENSSGYCFTKYAKFPEPISEEASERIFYAFLWDQPQFYFLNKTYSYYGRGQGTVAAMAFNLYEAFSDGGTRASETAKMKSAIESYLSLSRAKTTTYDKVKVLHDELCNQISYAYDRADFDQSSYSAFINHDTVCAGYAEAFNLLANASGIETISVASEGHEWNQVRMEDGLWYAVDVTWGDQKTWISYNYFLKSDDSMKARSDYDRTYHTPTETCESLHRPVCTKDYVQNSPVHAHSWTTQRVVTEPTCAAAGETLEICSSDACREVRSVSVAATGMHTAGAVVKENENAATCTATGSYEEAAYCTVCNTEMSRTTKTVKATGHDWGAWQVTKAATCTSAGTRVATCKKDSTHTKQESIAKLAHTAGTAVRENVVAATCVKAGSYDEVTYCAGCKAELSRAKKTIAATGKHTAGAAIKENIVAATCARAGSYDEVTYCTVCNTEMSRTTKTVKATGHDWGAWKVTKAATCTSAGTRVATCKNDSTHTKQESIAKPAHTAGTAVRENVVAATCVKAGSYDEVNYCTVCKAEISRNKLTIAATGHSWDSGTVTRAATTEQEGVRTYICTSCGATRTESIPKIAAQPQAPASVVTEPMYRLFYPDTHEHFYTRDAHERDVLSTERGWDYEGIAWYAPVEGEPVYRLYNPYTTDHHYTMDANEYETLARNGWTPEGIGWYSDPAKTTTLYRLYTRELEVGSHHYTADAHERSVLLESGSWVDEGVAWYGAGIP